MQPKWITAVPKQDKTSLYVFTKKVYVDSEVKEFVLRVSADTRYKLYFNGEEIVNGPCKSSPFVKYYEEVCLSDKVKMGENEITVKVLHVIDLDDSGVLYTEYFATAHHERTPALYVDGKIVTKTCEISVCSDESYCVNAIKNHDFKARKRICAGVAPFEEVYGDEELIPLSVKVLYTPNADLLYISRGGVKEKYQLAKRPIPLLPYNEYKPLKIAKEFIGDDGSYNLILETGRYTTDLLKFEYCAESGTEIKIMYTETPLTKAENGELFKGKRNNLDGDFTSPAYDLLVCSGNIQKFETYWFRAFRFITVKFTKKPQLFNAYSSRYTYDFDGNAVNGGIGSFECSNETYNKMWVIGKNTLECTAHETVVDCPFYEQAQYIGDGSYESLYAWRYSNDSHMQRKLLEDTAHSQQIDGQVLTVFPTSRDRHQNIVVSTAYFAIAMREHLRYTGDTSFLRKLTGVLDRALDYFENNLDENGLVMPKSGWRFIDWLDEWDNGVPTGGTESPMTINSLMYAYCLKASAQVCLECGRNGLASEYLARYELLISNVNKHCFDNEVGLYVDVLGRKEYSEHTMAWAIISGAISGDNARKLVDLTMSRTDIHRSGFPKNLHLLRAFELVGYYDKYAKQILSRWNGMIENACTTWCEDPVFQRSECHAWSSVPSYEFSQMILGVLPTASGYKKVRIKPTLLDLTYAKGRVPTPFGYIDIDWKIQNGKFTLQVKSNEKTDMQIVLPSGKEYLVKDNSFEISEDL